MKKLLIVLTMITTSVYACPKLAGKYLCQDFATGSKQTAEISEKIENGITSFQLKLTANGKTDIRVYTASNLAKKIDHPNYSNYTEKSFCENNQLKVHMLGVDKKTGAKLDAYVTVLINAKNDLYDSFIGTIGAEKINFEETCTRL